MFTAAQTGDPNAVPRIQGLQEDIDDLQSDTASATQSISSVKLSLIVMVVWVIVVTVALVVIGILSFRKWRRDYFMDTQSATTGSESQSSAGDHSDLGSSLNVMMETASTASDSPPDGGGEFNSCFEPDGAVSPASVPVSVEEDSISFPNVSSNLSNSTTSLDVHVPSSSPTEPAASPPTASIRL